MQTKYAVLICCVLLLAAWGVALTSPDDEILYSRAHPEVFKTLDQKPATAAGQPLLIQAAYIREQPPEHLIVITDKLFYKEVSMNLNGQSHILGYGYLNAFHPARP